MHNMISAPGGKGGICAHPASFCGAVYLATAVAALMAVCYQASRVIAAPYEQFAIYLPDDAFYYLQNALWFAESGAHTFDGGVSTNTGFHLLWFYWVSALTWVVDGDRLWLLRLCTFSSWIVCIGLALGALHRCYRNAAHQLLVVAVFMTSYAFVNGQVAAMEWHLCVLTGALVYLSFLFRAPSWGTFWLLLALGLMGSLARSDFGGVAAAILLASLIAQYANPHARYLRPAVGLFLGAVLGFALVSWHNVLVTGDWMSTSARMKQAWAQLSTPNPMAPLFQFARSALYLPPLTGGERIALRHEILHGALLSAPVVLALAGLAALRFRSRLASAVEQGWVLLRGNPPALLMALSSVFIVAGYLLLYSLNTMGMQSWYSAHVFVPLAFLCMLLLQWLYGSVGRCGWRVAQLCLVATVIANVAVRWYWPATYALQSALVEQGVALGQLRTERRLTAPVGISDAGIIGYYSGGHVVNLDGLVNADIVRYFPHSMPCYLFDQQIEYFSGFGWIYDNLGPGPDWKVFAQLRQFRLAGAAAVTLKVADFDKIDARWHCSSRQLARAN